MSQAFHREGKLALALALALSLAASGQNTSTSPDSTTLPAAASGCGAGCMVDARDGRIYPVATIAGKSWIARNLAFPTKDSWCAENDSAACGANGRFYEWSAALVACPPGWHLPADSDWATLARAVGGEDSAGILLKTKTGWTNDGNGKDAYGFAALPAGIHYSYGIFDGGGGHAFFWSSTEGARGRSSYHSLDAAYRDLNRSDMARNNGLSVRCVEN